MKKKVCFVADDGTEFDTERACKEYEEALTRLRVADLFLAGLTTVRGKPLTDGQKNFARYVIDRWETFKIREGQEDQEEPLTPPAEETAMGAAIRRAQTQTG